MSKNFNRKNTVIIRKNNFDNILKETKQNDLEYKTKKNIKIENTKNKNQNLI